MAKIYLGTKENQEKIIEMLGREQGVTLTKYLGTTTALNEGLNVLDYADEAKLNLGGVLREICYDLISEEKESIGTIKRGEELASNNQILKLIAKSRPGSNILAKSNIMKKYDLPAPVLTVISMNTNKKELINGKGSLNAGFIGEISSEQLISGNELASKIGLTAGTAQNSTAGWLAFSYKGKLQFVAKKPFRHSVSWDNINNANAVYGNKGINIHGLDFKVRLMRGYGEDMAPDPKITQNENVGRICHNSEWNKLMLPIHMNAPSDWKHVDNVNSPTENWNVGYTDADLLTHHSHGNGSYSWCQEVAEKALLRCARGVGGVSYAGSDASGDAHSRGGWRPVLELVD